jgi:hypothetical protein
MSSKWSLPFRFSNSNLMYAFLIFPYVLHAWPISSSLIYPVIIWWSTQVTKLLNMQSSSASHHFLPLRSKYKGVSKSVRTESITKYMFTTNTRWEATQRVTAAKLTRPTHKIAIQLHPVAESSTICSSRFKRPVRKLLDTSLYSNISQKIWPEQNVIKSNSLTLEGSEWTLSCWPSVQVN